MTMRSRTMLGVALTPVLALGLAAPAASAAPPSPAQDASTAAAAAPQLGPWTKPTRLDQPITNMVMAKNGTVVALADGKVLRRPAGATGWITKAAPGARGLMALPDGSVQLVGQDESPTTGVQTWTAVLAPGATEFSAAQPFAGHYEARFAGSASGHVVAAWYTDGKVYASERTAQGAWSAPATLATVAQPRYFRFVSLAVANDGTALVSWGDTPVGEARQFQTVEKAAGAAQWSAPRDLGLAGSPYDLQVFAHPKGGFHMVWNARADTAQSPDVALSYARRPAGTTSWSRAELVGTGTATGINAPMVLPNGDVLLMSSNRGPWYSVRSAAKGTWATGQRFPYTAQGALIHLRSALAPDGTVVVTWTRSSSVGRVPQVSTFVGGTWSAPTTLVGRPPEANSNSGDVIIDGQGRPLVQFTQWETRADGSSHEVGYLATTTPRKLPVRRDLTGDGKADVLGLSTAGNLKLISGAGLTKAPFTVPGWDPATEVLPFGDLNGDRCNDVFVRLPGGEARMYTPVCGGLPSPGSAYKKIASDWKGYDAFTAPGDLTGDGRTDLLARDVATGTLYLYADNGAGGFAARVKIGTGWNGYKKIIGAGDLTGDGKADLLALDTSGELWRFNGTGTGTGAGTFKSRVLVFKDWGGSYKDIVGAGDLNGDGKADLLSRDTLGRPWLNAGNGTGGFGNRTALGTEQIWDYTKIS
ncbi:VCBS repeat-containing protein [Streptomyces sp. TBY4]|uniref:FG-GAP repeat domain-containing protein n=1 Tax=Streptomyces sp. TBY4 TaxID=2962030 RepID=UPI0020B76059|nr:VCBS repeat-containing protein [Streptomyces sp. TBY4]MCP3758052.1 VCBS repeat-containing protein [Streptomyces sp. TBY4]